MALEGTLHYLDIAHLFQVVGHAQKSGVLRISWEERRAKMLFDRGRLTNAESSRFRQGIGTFLVNAGYLTDEDLERALAIQRSENGARRLGGILCDEFGLKPEDIERQLRRQFELIAFDVLSWPEGRFVFEFHEPKTAHDRFHVDPIEFILAVGIEAGFLAEEGLEREKAQKERRHVVFLEENQVLLARYRERWQRKGYWVTSSNVPREFVGYLREWSQSRPVLVVSESCGRDTPGGGASGGLAILERVRAAHPNMTAVVVGEDSPELVRRARQAGALEVVARPSSEELAGADADARIEVFLVALERAVAAARARTVASDGEPR